jgi:protein-tyrosine-phosphatase
MIIAVQGTKNFNDYNIFLRAMGTALSMMDSEDKEIKIYSAGTAITNSMSLEFSNISERSLKARGIRISSNKMPIGWLKSNISEIDYLIYLSKPKEPVSDLVELAEAKEIEVGVYRY